MSLFVEAGGRDHVGDHATDALAVASAQHRENGLGHFRQRDDLAANGVVEVVINVGRDVGHTCDLPLQRGCFVLDFVGQHFALALRVAQDSVADFGCQIQTLAILFQDFDHPDRLSPVMKATRHQLG